MKYIAFLAVLVAALTFAPPAAAATDWAWPVRGDVVTPYKNGDDAYASGQHRGIDIAAPIGARVVAAVSGRVTYAGVAGSSGLTVNVQTADGRYDVSYLHLSAAAVREGDVVDRGASLGSVGVSGNRSVDQPHLHFGVREAGDRHAYRDPLDFLPPLGPAAPDAPPATVPVAAPEAVTAPPASGPVLARVPEALAGPDQLPAGAAVAGLAVPHAPGVTQSPAVGAASSASATSDAPSTTASPTGAGSPGAAGSSAPNRAASPTADRGASSARLGVAQQPAASRRDAHRVTRSDLATPRSASTPTTREAPAQAAPGNRRAASPRNDSGGINLGWLAAVIGLVAAATCLGQPQAARRAGRRSRATLGAVLRPLTGRG